MTAQVFDESDLQRLAVEYLNACIDALNTTTQGAPSLSYISPGPPAWDCCDMLAVHSGGPGLADTFPLQPMLAPGERSNVQGSENLITMNATILRCAPKISNEGTLPSATEMNNVSAQTNSDMWAIWNWLKRRKQDGSLWDPQEREMFLDQAIPLNILGGCCGWQIQVRVSLWGYDALAAT